MPYMLKKGRLAVLGLAVTILLLVAFVGAPFWVAKGTFGRTFLDKPSFSIVAVHLSKNGTDCYIRSTVWNSGNVDIMKLTLSLNGTYVWTDGWISPNRLDDNYQRFVNYGSLHCADLQVGQSYSAGFLSTFADGVNQSAAQSLEVGRYPIPPTPA